MPEGSGHKLRGAEGESGVHPEDLGRTLAFPLPEMGFEQRGDATWLIVEGPPPGCVESRR